MHAQRGADGAFRVVLVGDRRPEQGHDLVADDLVEAASEVDDVDDQGVETGVNQAFHLLRVTAGRQRGEADQVRHQHGDEAALVGCGDQTLSALRAKACTFRYGQAARRAGHPVTIPAWARPTTPRIGPFAFRSTTAVPTIEKSFGER